MCFTQKIALMQHRKRLLPKRTKACLCIQTLRGGISARHAQLHNLDATTLTSNGTRCIQEHACNTFATVCRRDIHTKNLRLVSHLLTHAERHSSHAA